MLNIEQYPHASYDPRTRIGYLALYFSYPGPQSPEPTISMANWRKNSHSSAILNFKEGKKQHIEQFIAPFYQLIYQVMSLEKASEAYLVPMPSSRSPNSPDYCDQPRISKPNEARNRDNRNHVFCQFLRKKDEHQRLHIADIISRQFDKPEKARWSVMEHAQSLQLRRFDNLCGPSSVFILIDDVVTTGNTFGGARHLLNQRYPNVPVICLALGKTTTPHEFKPLVD
ncbi:MAG: phosphoribosyltransferase [Deltaproteobacteria bacterium]|nr:phosphoribosyltransferase [Deltaproteobacteria bacterium]